MWAEFCNDINLAFECLYKENPLTKKELKLLEVAIDNIENLIDCTKNDLLKEQLGKIINEIYKI
jgi:hypothetical protein